MEKYRVVIPAAGQGKRMGANINKQFIQLDGQPLILHTVRFFANDEACEEIILVTNKNECKIMEQIVSKYKKKKTITIVEGGKERQESVYNGLKQIKKEEIVLVHDGARPFLTEAMVRNLVTKAADVGAATVAVPVKDTIKKVQNSVVIDTLERKELYQIQTPQAFKRSVLNEAHEKAIETQYQGTDDASLVEAIGSDVHIVEGDYKNIKLTTQDDLLFAEAILQERKRKEQ